MPDLNDDDITEWMKISDDEEDLKPEAAKTYVPWAYIEKSASGDEEAGKMIDKEEALRLVEERELAFRYNEGEPV